MSSPSRKYAAGHAEAFDPAPEVSGDEPDFISGFRRPAKPDADRAKAKQSVAATAAAAANAKRFVANFMRKQQAANPSNAVTEEEDFSSGPQPPKFVPAAATGQKGFAGAVANHLKENEQRRSQVKAHRAHQMAVKGKYNKEVALTPTSAPPGAPRFYHALPTTLPLAYFVDLEARAHAVRFPPKAMASRGARSGDGDDAQPSHWEAEQVAKDLLAALKFDHTRNLCGQSAFVANEHIQSLKDVPLKEMVQGGAHWKAWRSAIETFLSTHATTAVNARYMLGANKGRWVLFGTSSVLDVVEGVLIHIWQSDTAAKEFINGWKRAWQAVFESRIDGITCPFSIAYRIQGSYVTATALIPIEPTMQRYVVETGDPWGSHGRPPAASEKLSDIAPAGSDAPVSVRTPALVAMMRRFCHATCIQVPPPLMRGLDGRYYIVDVRWLLQHSFGPKFVARPRLELLMQMRDLQGLYDLDLGTIAQLPPHLDRYGEEQAGLRSLMTSQLLQSPLSFVKIVAVRRCIIDIIRRCVDLELDGPVNVPVLVDSNVVRDQCRASGVNLIFLPLIMSTALTADIPESVVPEIHRLRFAPMIVEACQVEMLSRTIKDLANMDLSYGACASTPVNDVGRRIHVPNRIASFVVGKDELFFKDHIMARLRRKFHGLDDIGDFDMSIASAGRLLRNLTFTLGVELSEEQKRFTHFCPIAATKIMAFRPPRSAELYLQKQYATLDDEIPFMWRRWESTPTTSPVRHSAFIQCAFATLLCRASEKYAVALESADSCVADFDDDALLQVEVLAIAAETAQITQRDDRRLSEYRSLLSGLPRADDDAAILAVKYMNVALLTNDVSLATRAANALVRMDRATASIHSATCSFCIHAAEAMLVAPGCADADSLAVYLDMQRTHAQQKRIVGLAHAVEAMLHTTAVLVHADENSVAYSSSIGVEFGREALKLQLEGFGPRHRCTGIATYHLMIIALRALLKTCVPAVTRHMRICVDAFSKITETHDAKKMTALVRCPKSMELIDRVIGVLRDVGDKTTSGLLLQQRMSLEAGHLVDVEMDGNGRSLNADFEHMSPSPSGGLASSSRGSFALRMGAGEEVDIVSETSLHSPTAHDFGSPDSKSASPQRTKSSVRLGKAIAAIDDGDDLEMQQSVLRLSQVNFSFARPPKNHTVSEDDVTL